MRSRALLLLLTTCLAAVPPVAVLKAQTAGGNSVYNFLGLPATPLVNSLGGENISVISNEVTMSYQQPSLLRKEMHGQLGVVFNSILAGVKSYHLSGSVYSYSLQTAFAGNVQYFNYGELTRTDAAGNLAGSFRPKDFVAQVTASRAYGERWHYGAAIKFIGSDYGVYSSSAIAMDIGANYHDSSRQLQMGILLKNMGTQLNSHSGNGTESLPFDLQLGITKRLEKAPIQFSVTVRELHRLILYDADSTGTFDHIMQHFIFATQFFIANRIELGAGYNHLRRKELSIPNTSNGLTGFAMGIGVLLPRLQLRYSRNWMTNSNAGNQVGMTVLLKGE